MASLSRQSSFEGDWYLEFALKLIEDNFLLTALEFHTELVESGREVPTLREFFSNPSNFEQQACQGPNISLSLPRSSSQATLDSLDMTRFSEDGERTADERVAVLEFELRKAKETINSLRTNLTVAASESEVDKSRAGDNLQTSPQYQPMSSQLIKPHEQRAINFLINEYLMRHGYKLTSITFADENESQDFDDWEDVGLNMAQPPELLWLYREGMRGGFNEKFESNEKDIKIIETKDAIIQTQLFNESKINNQMLEMEDEIAKLNKEIIKLKAVVEELEQKLVIAQETQHSNEVTQPGDCFEIVDCSRDSSETNSDWSKINEPMKNNTCINDNNILSSEDWDVSQNESINYNLQRTCPDVFKNRVLKLCDIKACISSCDVLDLLEKNSDGVIDVNKLIEFISECLPKIVPNVILNKREEIIPLLILCISLSRVAKTRDQLISLLFNLKKKPQENERQSILSALLSISKLVGSSITESELLPPCWEQVSHKYVERRLLVAESCFHLSPYVSEEIRNSLILSMVQQLCHDREETVRRATVSCLARLITLISVHDKFTQFCDLTLILLHDELPTVSGYVQHFLLPVLAQWSFSLGNFQSTFFERIITFPPNDSIVCRIKACETLLPFLVLFVACSEKVKEHIEEPHPLPSKRLDFADLCKDLCDPTIFQTLPIGTVMGTFDYLTSNLEDSSDWAELNWILEKFLPVIMEASETYKDDKNVLVALVSLLRHLSAGLGSNIAKNLIKPVLSQNIEQCSEALIQNQDSPNVGIIPMYLVGLLSVLPKNESLCTLLKGTLFQFICALPLCGCPLTSMHVTVELLCVKEPFRTLVLDILWEGVVHQRALVRAAAASLFQTIISANMPENILNLKVTPALITLANDPEIGVKISTVHALGLLLVQATDKESRDKASMTLQSLMQEGVIASNISLILQLLKTFMDIYNELEVSFVNDVLLLFFERFVGVVKDTKNIDLVNSLTNAYYIISFGQTPLSHSVISNSLLPSIRLLDNCSRQLNIPVDEKIAAMLRHLQNHLPSPESPQTLSPGVKSVEEVRNKVTNIFNTRQYVFKRKS